MQLSVPNFVGRFFLFVAVLSAAISVATPASARQPSVFCPVLNATVANGGSVAINVSTCDGPFDAGMSAGGVLMPVNGTYTIGPNTAGVQFVTYVHSGNSATNDSFELIDEDLGIVTINITISAPTSSINVSPANLSAMVAGTPFSQSLSSAGGTSPYSYSLDSGSLPTGLSLSSNGLISGTPTNRGPYAFNVRVTDSTLPTAQSTVKGYTGNVGIPTLTLTTPVGTAIQGVPFSQTLATSGGVAPYTYALEASSLPSGLTLSSTGVISGTTTVAAGNYPVTIRVRESSTPSSAPVFELETFTLTVSPPPSVSIVVSPASLSEDGPANATVTVARSLNLSSPTQVNITTTGTAASGSDYSGAVSTIVIPAGATTATFTIDPTLDSAIEPNETAIFTIAAGAGYTVGSPASATLTINNDDNATATISVSPSATFENDPTNLVYTVTLSQAAASPVSVNFSLGGTATNGNDYATAGSPLIIPAGSTSGTIIIDPTGDSAVESDETVSVTLAGGTGYTVGGASSATATIRNDDGTSVYCPSLSATVAWGGTVSIDAGTCTAGFGLGVVLTPPAHGSATIGAFGPNQPIIYTHNGTSGATDTFTVNDGDPPPNNQIRVNITILPPTSAISVTPATLPSMQAGTVFTQSLSSSGGTAPYSYSVSGGTLPPGISLSPGGVLSGTPTQRGAYSFTVRSLDALGASADRGYSGTVAVPALVLATPTATAIQGVPFSQALNTTGGIAPYSYLLESGTLPAGITLSSAGVLSGTTNAGPGTFPVTIRVTDSSSGPGFYFELESFTLTVSPAPTVSISVAPANVGEDGAASLVYTLTRSLNLSSPTNVNVTTSGTATSGSDYSGATSTVSIPAGATTATVTIDPATDTVVEPDETVTLTIAAGTGYVVGSPASATGTILNDDQPALSVNDVTVTEGNSGTVNAEFTVSLSSPAGPSGVTFDIATADGTATAGTDYVARSLTGQTIAAGSSSYTFSVAVNGDALNETGESFLVNVTNITGATLSDGQGLGTIGNDDPLPALSINDVTVTEGNSGTVTAQFTVSLNAPSGQTVLVNFATADGTASQPADYAATSGTLTFGPGQTAQSISVPVAGDTIPEADETFVLNLTGEVNATITDGQGTASITNDDVPVTVTPASVATGAVGQAYSQTLGANGGTAPYGFAVTSGALPAGISLSGSGVLSGTPTAAGTFTFSVTATDSSAAPGPFSGTRAYTLTVAEPVISLPSAALPGGTVGSSYSASVPAASGGTAPYTYAIVSGTLPGGLTLDAATGAISGVPSQPGSYLFDVTATDSTTGTGPFSATQAFSIEVADIPPVVNAVTMSVPYNSGPVNVPVTFTGGTPTSYGEVTSPANGTVITLGTVITYQPNPGYAGPDSFTYNANNSGGTSAPAIVTITVGDPIIAVTASGSLATSVGAPYTETFSFSGGAAPFTGFQVTGLPAGLAVTATTTDSVTVSGTPTQAGSFSLNVSATDSSTGNGPFTTAGTFALDVAPPTLALSPAPGVLTAAYGAPFSQSFTASGGIGGYSYSLAGTLPPGLSLTGNSITGTPTVPGSYSFSVTARDDGATGAGAPFSITQAYTIDVPGPTIILSPAALANGTAAAPYSQTITASGGVTPLSFSVGGGALPVGITLSADGTLSGVPSEVGSFTFSVTATDANGQSGSRSYTIVVAAPALSLAPAPGTLALAYGGALSQGFAATGGNGPYNYAISGSLPAGITFDPGSGLLSGSTFVVGDFAFTVTATDTGTSGAGAPFTVAGSYTLRVAPPTLAITPATLPGATVGNSYNSSITANGGAAPYNFAITAGALPAGLSLSPAGVLSGTPSAGGTFTFTVTASDSGPAPGPFTVSRSYSLEVAAPILTLPATSLPGGQRGTGYAATLNPATGGTAPYTYSVTGGALPAGLSLSSGGTLSGTPTVFGTFSFRVTATDSSTGTGPFTATQDYSLAIIADPPVAGPVSVSLPYGAPSTPITLDLSGGPASSVAIQTGPANGTASVSGTVISYQPFAGFSGTDTLTYTASNDGGTSAPATVTITIGAPALSVTASGPLDATIGVPYAQTFSFAGGSAPFRSYEVTGLPAGLALTGTSTNSVTISGTPRSQGSFTLSVSATDSSTGNGPFTASQTFVLSVGAPDLVLAPSSAAFDAPYAAPFSQTFSASGGIGAYSYVVSGSLPTGITLDGTTGVLSGTATRTGSFAFTITATDNGASGSGAPFTVAGSYTLNIAAPTITVTPGTLPDASAGTPYDVSLTGSGAVAPYTFTLTGGALPAGLSLSPAGRIAGTPTASGAFPFTVTISDANGQSAQASLTLTVDVPLLTVTPATLADAAQGIAYSQALTVNGGIAPYRFNVSAGALPPGLSLDPVRGIISGTPTGSGTANFSVTVTDSTGGTPATVTVSYALRITARPDPALDPEVRGLTQAQVLASRRFADTQVSNFMRRLESMHGAARSSGGFQNGIRMTTRDLCQDTVTSWTNEICLQSAAQPGMREPDGAGSGAAIQGEGAASAPAERDWTVWTGGTIRFGELDAASGTAGQDFESEGLSLGADYRFSPSFAAGLGIGFGRDTVDVGENQSRSSGEATTIAVYGSHQFGSGIFLDWLGGYQWLDFDLRRHVTSTGALVNSNRSGSQWFATGSAGADIVTGNWQITPYARVDLRRGTLNGYTENSGSMFDLRFLDQDVDFTSLGLGTVVNYRHRFRRATLLPRLRIEYLHDVERSAEARVAYADLISGPFSAIPLTGISREQLTLGLGTELLFGEALSLELEYLGRIASGSGTDQSLQAGVNLKF